MSVRAKICGLKSEEAIITAQNNGAEFLGFIFCAGSPRHLSPVKAGRIAKAATAKKVAVVVDADDTLLQTIIDELQPDYIQLHGKESDNRARDIKQKFKLPLIRSTLPNAYPSPTNAYPELVSGYAGYSLYDYLLIDAPGGGGKGVPFDWKSFTPPKQAWFLSGGLNVDNIREAVKTTGALMVDVSSGVESSPGVKDLDKIEIFLKTVNEPR